MIRVRLTTGRVFSQLALPVLSCLAALAPVVLHASDVPLVADTYVSGANPTLNFGALANLNVGNSANGNVALLKFDLSVLPAAGIAKATLRVFVNKVGTPGSIDVLQVSSPWAEGAITGQFPPALGGIVATAVPVTTSGGYVTVDVTTMVQNWVVLSAFYPNNGIAIVADASAPATAIFLDSKESTSTSHPATLDVTLIGRPGSQGPAGPAGATGAVGPAGPQGSPGATGTPGATGPQGTQGVAGVQGPAGSPGAQGVPGAQGIQGPAGQPGAAGAAGAGLVWRGAWNPDGNFIYAANDAVSFNGSSYVALSINSGQQPDINAQTWSLLASIGAAGSPGTAGAQGAQGPAGSAGAQGAPGAQGPQGPAGLPGATGATGAAGTVAGLNWRGVWNPDPNVLYAANDAVNYNGSSYVALSLNSGLQPNLNPKSWSLLASVGAAGAPGAQGVAGSPGATGQAGPQGAQGVPGAQGPAGPSHTYFRGGTNQACNSIFGIGLPCSTSTLTIPAGSYVLQARIDLVNSGVTSGLFVQPTAIDVDCQLKSSASGTLDTNFFTNLLFRGPDSAVGGGSIALQAAFTIAQATDISASCSSGDQNTAFGINGYSMIATQVGGIN